MSSRVSLCRCGHGSETPTASKVAFALQYKTIFRLDFSLSHSNQSLFSFTYLTLSLRLSFLTYLLLCPQINTSIAFLIKKGT
jgi:hypothetical protein